jgi:hypothetical protein
VTGPAFHVLLGLRHRAERIQADPLRFRMAKVVALMALKHKHSAAYAYWAGSRVLVNRT